MTAKEIVKERLEQLAAAADGVLTPDMVVADAKLATSPLHDNAGFIWDVDRAASAHWLAHARRLISSVEIQYRTERHTIMGYAYTRDPRVPANEQGYVAVSKLVTDRELSLRAMNEELARCRAYADRVVKLGEVLGYDAQSILTAIDVVQTSLNADVAA